MKNLLCAVLAAILSISALPMESYARSQLSFQEQGGIGSNQIQFGGNQLTELSLSERKITYPGYNANVGTTVLPDGWTMQVSHLIIGTESLTCPNAIFLTATRSDGKAKMLFLSERQFVQTYTNLMGFESRSSDDAFDYSTMMHALDYRDAAACCDLMANTLFDDSSTFLRDFSLTAEDQAILADAKARYDAATQEDFAAMGGLLGENMQLTASDFTYAARTYLAGSQKITVQAYSAGFQIHSNLGTMGYYSNSSSYSESIYWKMPCVYALWTDADEHDDYMGAFQAFALGTNVSKEYERFCNLNSERMGTAMLDYKNGKTDSFDDLEKWEKENAAMTIQAGETYGELENWRDYTTMDGIHMKMPNAYNHVRKG